MNKYKKFIIITSITALTSGCGAFFERAPSGWPLIEPRPATGVRGFPSTATDYGKGFRAGCGAAFDAVTKGLPSEVTPAEIDPKQLANNPDYSRGWWDGMEQCVYIVDWDVV